MTHTWFITGSSRGLGRALARVALEAGDNVVATARRPDSLADLVESHGPSILPVELDVTSPPGVERAFAAATERFGRVDVVVNNAGYANLGSIEGTEESDFRVQFETNFWGAYNVSRAAVGRLRAQGGGLIIQVSSIGGRVGASPGLASYQAAKFALDGFTRVLAAETAPFGIRTVVVEPSGFATDWAGSSMTVHDIPPEYDSTIGELHRLMLSVSAGGAGDPDRAAQILVQLAKSDDPPSHLLLGAMACDAAVAYSADQVKQAARWAQVSRSADFNEPFPVAFP